MFPWIYIRGFAKSSFVFELCLVSLTLSDVSATPDSLVTQTGHKNKRLLFHSIPSYKVER